MQSTARLITFSIVALGLSIIGLNIISCSEKSEEAPKKYTSVTIVKGNQSEYPATVQLIMSSPMPDEILKSDSVTIDLRVDGFEIGLPSEHEQSQGLAFSPDGQHACAVIDDTMQVVMPTGVATIGPLKPGRHTLQAFARYSWYESVKAPKAFASYAFFVRNRGGDTTVLKKEPKRKKGADTVTEVVMPVKEVLPMLVYNSPSVDVSENDAERVLLDFYVVNAELAPGKYRVTAAVDGGKADTLTKWCPYYIEGLKIGSHKVRIALIASDGTLIKSHERSFKVTEGSMKQEEN